MIQRQRVDFELVWELMRFADERESWQGPQRGVSDPMNGPICEMSGSGRAAGLRDAAEA